ncbi:formate/nitrite transporter family protein [Domibacillus sp. A3M-37]|uniref:formate/nitrite transporter family protein n=1 Tax=Domibacillus sp. A3M-37 TaxID=2962037 RepID=UPI0020B64AE2|nr:formate/nitrite transporter family protein [Domibacillus sp. A3M-37]MCP3762759.1 formate/nitrite transporter family protein [Domibacillus sp. A3M-37]
MSLYSPQEIAVMASESGEKKANLPLVTLLILGFLGGAYISLGFLLDIRVIANVPKEWGSFTSFLGAAVFPVGLILVILGGAELVTGNMMTVTMAWLSKKITFLKVLRNLFLVTIANFIGAVFVAYFFGHIVGLTEEGPFLAKTTAIAQAKLDESFLQAFISAIGCNWLVCLAVWLALGSKDFTGKILGIWFPVMAFVAIGFQHVVANMFVIPAAIFAGQVTWAEYVPNFIAVFLGNVIGGAVLVSLLYFIAYKNSFGTKPKMISRTKSA